MPVCRRHRLGLTAVALLTGATTLPAPAAQAAPVFAKSALFASASATTTAPGDCTVVQTRSAPVADEPVTENGPTVTASASTTGTVTRNGDNGDVVAFDSRLTGTATVTSAGGDPKVLELAVTGTVAATTTKPVAGCQLNAYSPFHLAHSFTVAHSGFLTVTVAAGTRTHGEFYLEDAGNRDRYFRLDGSGPAFNDAITIHLPPGTYKGFFYGDALVRTNTGIAPTPIGASVRAEFVVAGAQTAAPAGKAMPYVGLPASRSCDTHSLDVTVTANRKRAKKVKQVNVFVDDELVQKAKNPRKGQVIQTPVADEAAADVRTEVTLRPVKRGRPSKTYEVTASYAPCS